LPKETIVLAGSERDFEEEPTAMAIDGRALLDRGRSGALEKEKGI
jgi:hypothetical protein